MGRSLTEILEENEAWRASHLHVYDGYCQPCAERDAERSQARLAAAEKVVVAARFLVDGMRKDDDVRRLSLINRTRFTLLAEATEEESVE